VNDGTGAVNDLADEITGATTDATKKIDVAAKKVSAAKADAASALAHEVTEDPDTSH
jgi:hypothetical protein